MAESRRKTAMIAAATGLLTAATSHIGTRFAMPAQAQARTSDQLLIEGQQALRAEMILLRTSIENLNMRLSHLEGVWDARKRPAP